METGVFIDGVVTSQLLLNIFYKNTPLHDGAVMIRENRVVAAACYLPLSPNPDISQELGTRHRASIGITEQSDCLTIVVSEETGTVSLAQDGKLIRYLDGKMLGDLLRQTYFEEELNVKDVLPTWMKWGGPRDE
jgi:diadenylate cyclase